MTSRLDPAELFIPVGFGLTAAVVGGLAGAQPIVAIAAASAIALLLLTLSDMTAGLIGFVALSFLELVPSLTGPALSLAKLAGAVLAISWLASATTFGSSRKQFPAEHPGLTVAFLLILGWNTLSFVWAEDNTRIPLASLSFALNFALFPIVFAAVSNKRDARNVFVAFVAGATLAALYGYATTPSAASLATSASAAGGLNRLAGTVADPNEFATLLVTGMALATALLFSKKEAFPTRLAVAGAILFLLFAVLLTLSRGGLVALAAALIVGVFVAHRGRAQALIATGAILVGTAIFFISNPVALDRVTNSDGGSGRTDVWNIGWRMVEDEPLRGVGAGNFQVSSIHYLIEPGTVKFDEYIVDQPVVAHNMYLQVLAELGVVGLVLFLGIVGVCISMTVRAYRLFASREDSEGVLLSAASLMAIAALLAGYFFLSEEHSKHLWLMMALGPTLLAIARREAEAADGV